MIKKKFRPPPEDWTDAAAEESETSPPVQKRPRGTDEKRLIQQPGVPKPEEADAVGEGDVERLAQETDEEALEERTEEAQRERPRTKGNEPPPDIRRRAHETKDARR